MIAHELHRSGTFWAFLLSIAGAEDYEKRMETLGSGPNRCPCNGPCSSGSDRSA
jgi:hypothetical protein